ncbi:MAG: hypothetical protein KGM24_10995 [Elusimicrobia bacterium]|nr:hypothetical protein [Elusimicrobiota bacterium]
MAASRRMRTAALALLLAPGAAAPARAARFIAVPWAGTVPSGHYSLWQFGLYEQKGNKHWRSLNRLDLGLGGGAEFGAFTISPKGKQPDSWINLQWQPVPEGEFLPALSVGVWDALRKAPLFSSRTAGPSPFLAAGKTFKKGSRYAKIGLDLGANRLDGLSGGLDVRFLKGTGAMLEFQPRNLRLPGTDAWDAALYQWFGPHARVRVSRMGGNPMIDGLFAWSFGGAGRSDGRP